MKPGLLLLLGGVVLICAHSALAETGGLSLQRTVQAGNAISIRTSGNGSAVLYIIGLGQVLKRDVQLGGTESFPADSLRNAGHYLSILVGPSGTEVRSFDVVPATAPANLSFLARPSRVPVSIEHGITGAVYVFDAYGNLILAPTPVSFELSYQSGVGQKDNVITRGGAAWAEMNSTGQQGIDQFVARTTQASSKRVVRQVPGDPCALKLSARQSGQQLQLETEPVRDCRGNAVSDGTIITFTEAYDGGQSTVDVPLKHGIAKVDMPVHPEATISVASGIVLGNEIRLGP